MPFRKRLDAPPLVEAIQAKFEELGTDRCSLRILTTTAGGGQMMWLNATAVDHATMRDGGEVAHVVLIMAEPMYEYQAVEVKDLRTPKDKT